MCTDIDIEYHLQLSTTSNLTVNKSIILTHAKRRDLYCRAYPYILQGTVKFSCISSDSSTRFLQQKVPFCYVKWVNKNMRHINLYLHKYLLIIWWYCTGSVTMWIPKVKQMITGNVYRTHITGNELQQLKILHA